MKEKDFEKCLDNLIIDGLIKEAEQDNADFEAAMRNMSDEDFLALIYNGASNPMAYSFENKENAEHVYKNLIFEEGFSFRPPKKSQLKRNNWKPWVAAIASVAAILLLVLIPANNSMNSKICQSALLASSSYMEPTKGIDIATMPDDEIRAKLPELEKQYAASIKPEEKYFVADEPNEEFSEEYYLIATDSQEAGMDLVQAYLKLNEKDKAIEVLRELSDKYGDADFGNHCRRLLEILE